MTPRRFATLMLIALGACESGTAPVSDNASPLMYVVVTRDLQPANAPGVAALVLTAGNPNASPYRSVETFDMRRASDGGRFAWTALPRSGISPANYDGLSLTLESANYLLPKASDASGLGADGLLPGDRLSLHLVTEGVDVEGAAIVVGPLTLSTTQSGGTTSVTWEPAVGAAGYYVTDDLLNADFLRAPPYLVHAPRLGSTPSTVTVVAVDENLVRFMSLDSPPRVGLSAGYGVFGSFSRASIALPSTP